MINYLKVQELALPSVALIA